MDYRFCSLGRAGLLVEKGNRRRRPYRTGEKQVIIPSCPKRSVVKLSPIYANAGKSGPFQKRRLGPIQIGSVGVVERLFLVVASFTVERSVRDSPSVARAGQTRSGILGKLHSQAVQELSILGTRIKFAVLDDDASAA